MTTTPPALDTLALHPRLLSTDLAGVRSLVAGDERARRWYRSYQDAAEQLLSMPVCEYRLPDGRRLLATSREVLRRAYTLALAHHVSGRGDFVERLWSELAAAAAFPDWNPAHFLDVGEMAHGFAIAYDWLYERWDQDRREILRRAIVDHALLPGLRAHRDEDDPNYWWTVGTTNWNLVCNGGLVMGALAVGDVERELAADVIEAALSSMPRAVEVYAPDGAYPEGQAYWGYGTQYLVLAAASLASATGGGEPLSAIPGVDRATRFPVHLTGPLGQSFNYYDGAPRPSRPPALFWLADRFDDGVAAWWAAGRADELPIDHEQLPTSLIWYRPGSTVDPMTAGMERDSYFRGSEIVTMRSAWNQHGALWLAAKAGDNAAAHSDLDLGAFVLDALGTRWFHDFGSDDYNLPGYFDFAGGRRWALYRKRTEGHNTLVANPDASGGQSCAATTGDPAELGKGRIVARDSSTTESYAIADLTAAAPDYTHWHRGWRLFDDRRQVLVQDEVTLTSPGCIWSFLHTAARITVAPDGRSATLADGPRRLLVRLLDHTPGALVEMDAAPLWSSPRPERQAANEGMRKLGLKMSVDRPVTIAVQMTPMLLGEPVPPRATPVRLAEWSVPATPPAELVELEVDGVPVPDFAAEVRSYELPAEVVGKVRAVPGPGGTVTELREAGGAVVLETRSPGAQTSRYCVRPRLDDSPQAMTSTTFASSDDGNVAALAFDGRPDSYWRPAQAGPEWLGCDLGHAGATDAAVVRWHSASGMEVGVAIEVAVEGGSWQRVWTGVSASEPGGILEATWPTVPARYLRLLREDAGPPAAFAVTALEVKGRVPAIPAEPETSDIRVVVPPIAAGTARRAEVSVRSTTGRLAARDEYDLELISSAPDVAAIDGLSVVGVAPGIAVVTAVIITNSRRLLHRSLEVQVDPATEQESAGS